MFKRWFNIDQDENDGGGGAGGGTGNQDGGGAGEAEAAAAAAAAAGGDGKPSGSAGNDGNTNQKPAWEKDSILWNGQQKEFTRQEIINYAQQAYNVTQREQAASKKQKEANAQLIRLEKLIEAADKKGGEGGEGGGDGEAPDPIKSLTQQLQDLSQRELQRQWRDFFSTIKQKFPGIDEGKVNDTFLEKLEAGEVEDSEAGLMAVAIEVDKTLTAENTEKENKQIEKLLANSADARIKTHNAKVIAGYLADKKKLANAGGDHGPGGGGDKKDADPGSISEIATRIRKSISA